MPKVILTYIDAPDWPPPTSDDPSSERPVAERTRACTLLVYQARRPVCPCQLCTRYVLVGEDARYSWSHTARSGHACHRRHPRKILTKENYLRTQKENQVQRISLVRMRLCKILNKSTKRLDNFHRRNCENERNGKFKRNQKKKKESKCWRVNQPDRSVVLCRLARGTDVERGTRRRVPASSRHLSCYTRTAPSPTAASFENSTPHCCCAKINNANLE